ncbi:hypothetical protein KBX71_29045 [Micromonospora sp. D93]|uniref:hypothetical protein n=1 Tax=Micromonospora sp. D93 TaxID=2824886 RepID=UPI001B389DE1|nr:hypothetical protein [Micromonospora sp. D93]MBQ1021900.1 hypothetical protein [Micromonospora sp. D93]
MRDARTGRVKISDLIFFYGLPVLVGTAAYLLSWHVKGIDNLLAALSILTGLLFNLLVLLFDTAARFKGRPTGKVSADNAHKYRLLHELQANITYTLGVGLLVAIILGVCSLAGIEDAQRPWSVVVTASLAHFVLLLGMLLKRLRSVFLAEFPRLLGA